MGNEKLPTSHFLLALAVVAVWGSNFVVIKLTLFTLPPLLFAALRFVFALLPAIFFLPKPKVSWLNLAAYGFFIGVGQFGLLYIAVQSHISAGLSSVVVQSQAFFTIGLAMYFAREQIRQFQFIALLVCLIGLGIIASHTDQDTDFLGLALVLLGALSWGIGNTVSRNAGKINMLAYVVWSSIFSVIPLIVLSLIFEGWDLIQTSLGGLNSTLWAAILWQSWGNTLFGFAAWAWLLARHPAAVVAPISLLVPVLGIGSAAIFLGEPLPLWKIAAATLVIVGLGINIYWPIIRARLKSSV